VIDLLLRRRRRLRVAGRVHEGGQRGRQAVPRAFRTPRDIPCALINNAKTVADTPIASVTALKATLSRLADVMDRDEDILFLFLTSPRLGGSPLLAGFLAVALQAARSEDAEAAARRIRHQAARRRRVRVLFGRVRRVAQEENTLVITASAPDRNFLRLQQRSRFHLLRQGLFRRGAARKPIPSSRRSKRRSR